MTQNKDAQGDKLVDTAKKNNRTHYLTVWSAPEMDMGDQIKNAGIDIFNKFGGYGPDDLKDADSIVDYYNEVGKALKYIIDNTTEAERAAGGTYHSLYQFLLDEQTALRDDVDSYNDSTDAINNNTNARRELQAVDFWQNDNNNSMDVSFTFDKVNSAVQTLEDTIDGFDASKLNDLLWGTNEGLSDEQAQALANLRKALTDMDFSADTNGVNAFIQALVQVGIVAQSSANGVDAVAQASQKMEDISSEIDEIQTAYKNATTAIDEYNKYGYLSADTLQTLLNEDFEYLSCLELVDGQLQVNTEKYQGMLMSRVLRCWFVSRIPVGTLILRLAMVLSLPISPLACSRWAATRMHGSRSRWQSTVLSRLFRAAVEMLQLRLAILLSRIPLAALMLWQMKSNRSYRLRLLKCKVSGK